MLMMRRFGGWGFCPSFASPRGLPVTGSISPSICRCRSSSSRSRRIFARPSCPSASSIVPSKLRSNRRSSSPRLSGAAGAEAAESFDSDRPRGGAPMLRGGRDGDCAPADPPMTTANAITPRRLAPRSPLLDGRCGTLRKRGCCPSTDRSRRVLRTGCSTLRGGKESRPWTSLLHPTALDAERINAGATGCGCRGSR